jgi:hypothetical protein
MGYVSRSVVRYFPWKQAPDVGDLAVARANALAEIEEDVILSRLPGHETRGDTLNRKRMPSGP